MNKDSFIQQHGAFNAFQTSNGQTPADIAGDLGNMKSLKEIVTHFHNKEEANILSCFAPLSIKKKFEASRFTNQRSKHIQISRNDTLPQRIKLAHLNSKSFTKQMQSYIRIAYWAIFIANDSDGDPEAEIFMKKFLYFFILDLGISPFIKCYEKKSIVQACIKAGRLDFLREILSHEYELLDKKDAEIFKKSARGKDKLGENIYHEIFKLSKNKRNKFLELIKDEKNFLKIYIKPQERGCCNRRNQIEIADDCELYSIGDIKKRNKESIEPTDYEHEQPIQISEKVLILDKSKEIE